MFFNDAAVYENKHAGCGRCQHLAMPGRLQSSSTKVTDECPLRPTDCNRPFPTSVENRNQPVRGWTIGWPQDRSVT